MNRPLMFDYSMEAIVQYFTVVLFIFQFFSACNFATFINFELKKEFDFFCISSQIVSYPTFTVEIVKKTVSRKVTCM